ncbi:dTMP kinase [Accumulibacter sp.]|uniref:dTMP kinase n=1 Tax=Accumulibacter sp. TaxID=2053492 RepID=UPI0025F305BF|nr:dTMP kinase [Accumulibacter sp.]MCM8611331.1 dTMP kinase [Accumulibacter sp.]MCM8635022.1 dTMP kinase [Accumulibacter sp.]MCM8639810.1 dTMP kinase [Accumulibacter sp.]
MNHAQSGSRGRFITCEGIDGAGKSSHIATIVESLRRRGVAVVSTREPGGTALGEKLRALLLHETMHLETEALLMFAARREHIARVIEPALARGDWVVCDRFSDATYAYQSGGRGLDPVKFAQLEGWVHPLLQPDLSLLFDLPAAVAARRIAEQARDRDRFEMEHVTFHERVRLAYLERARVAPQRITVIDADQSPERVSKQIEERISTLCL